MKTVFLIVKNSLLSFAKWAGPFGCIVVALAIVLVARRQFMPTGMFKGWTTRREISADTIITGVRKMSLLKPYKVITAGFCTEVRTEGEATAKLDYQYKGMAEYFVDLSDMKIILDDEVLKVTLHLPVLGEPALLPLPKIRLWHFDAPFKMRHWDDQFRLEMHEIRSQRIRQDIDTPENLEKAKEQTERILRFMFLPTGIDESKIKFEWLVDATSQPN